MWTIRKAILTGGGRATRLRPITSTINKHLIPLANKPMIFHAIEKAVEAGVREIFINTNPGETELQKAIGDGGHWGVKIQFFEQEGGPQGIAHVVKQAERFIGGDPFLFFLSDNIIMGSLRPMFDAFAQGGHDCMLALARVPDNRALGVPVFDDAGKLVDVWEKPQNPPNSFGVTGIYLYGPGIFFDAYDHIERSARGEYEISSIHSHFLKTGRSVGCHEITGLWKDTGQSGDLLVANRALLEALPSEHFRFQAERDATTEITGNVHVGVGTTFGPNVHIYGPVMIGENCTLENCTIHPFTTIGTGCVIKNAEIRESILFNHCHVECDVRICHSLIGEKVKVLKHPENLHRLILGDYTTLEI